VRGKYGWLAPRAGGYTPREDGSTVRGNPPTRQVAGPPVGIKGYTAKVGLRKPGQDWVSKLRTLHAVHHWVNDIGGGWVCATCREKIKPIPGSNLTAEQTAIVRDRTAQYSGTWTRWQD
jgi:hypothetical protein